MLVFYHGVLQAKEKKCHVRNVTQNVIFVVRENCSENEFEKNIFLIILFHAGECYKCKKNDPPFFLNL